ncbi:MAG: dihydrofolate reductase [Nanoarchaeota archaeon]|mgnify:CR=1 FL=1
MNLTIIAAISENNVIGNQNNIPWEIPEDIKRFRNLTLNHPVIVGRKTFESIIKKLGKPLSKRKNIVLTNSLNEFQGIYTARTIKEALELTEDKDSYVIGGRQVYELFLPLVNCLEITRVHKNVEGDTFFPEVNWEGWDLINEHKKADYSFLTYLRK